MKNQGFTIIEMVIVTALFGLLSIVAMAFLINVIQSGNRATIENEVRQNANKVLQDVVSEMRKKNCISSYTTTNPITYHLTLSDNDTTANKCATTGNRVGYAVNISTGVIQKLTFDASGSTSGPITLTASSVALVSCPIQSCAGLNSSTGFPTTDCSSGLTINPTDSNSYSGTYTVTVNAMQNSQSTRSDFCANVSLQDTVVPRAY